MNANGVLSNDENKKNSEKIYTVLDNGGTVSEAQLCVGKAAPFWSLLIEQTAFTQALLDMHVCARPHVCVCVCACGGVNLLQKCVSQLVPTLL